MLQKPVVSGKASSLQKENIPKVRTLEDWTRVWIQDVLPGVIKETTIAMYRDTMERHILPALGQKDLQELDSKVVELWLFRLQNTQIPGTIQGKMTEGTVRNTLSVLSGCLRDAQKYGLIGQNPCLKPSWAVHGKNLWENREWLDEEQIEKLEPIVMQYRDENGYPKGICFQLVLYAGMSMSEALALRWKDVDLEQSMIHVQYFLAVRKDQRELEKVAGRKERNIPIPDFLAQRLLKIYKIYGTNEEYFVTNPSEQEPVHMDTMRAILLRRSQRAGVGRVTPRMLRDTYAIRAVQAGATSDMIAELMGFASAQQVVRRYMPRIPCDKKNLVNQMYRI